MLPAGSYARGFLEVYATRLGLESQLYLDEFDSRFAEGQRDGTSVRRVRSDRRLRFEANAVVLGLLGILVVTVLVIAAWQFSGGSPDKAAAPERVVDPAPAAAPTTPDPSPAPPVAQPAPVAEAEPAEPEPLPITQDAVLEVRATEPGVRVTVRRNGTDGASAVHGSARAGRSQSLPGPPNPRCVPRASIGRGNGKRRGVADGSAAPRCDGRRLAPRVSFQTCEGPPA